MAGINKNGQTVCFYKFQRKAVTDSLCKRLQVFTFDVCTRFIGCLLRSQWWTIRVCGWLNYLMWQSKSGLYVWRTDRRSLAHQQFQFSSDNNSATLMSLETDSSLYYHKQCIIDKDFHQLDKRLRETAIISNWSCKKGNVTSGENHI
jgi:hypothetical protein